MEISLKVLCCKIIPPLVSFEDKISKSSLPICSSAINISQVKENQSQAKIPSVYI